MEIPYVGAIAMFGERFDSSSFCSIRETVFQESKHGLYFHWQVFSGWIHQPGMTTAITGTVSALTVADGKVYVGGVFTSVGISLGSAWLC